MDDNKLEDAMAENVEKSFNDDELQDIMDEIETLEKEFVEEPESEAAHIDPELALSEAKDNSLQNAIDKEVESIGDEISDEANLEASEELAQAVIEEPLGNFDGEDLANEVEAELAETSAQEVIAESEEAVAEVVAQETNAVDEAVVQEVVAEEVAQEVVAEVEEPVQETVAEEPVVVEVCEETPDNVVAFTPAPKEVSTDSTGSTMDFSAQGNMNLNLNFSIGEEAGTLVVNQENGLKVAVSGVEFHISEESGCIVKMPGGIKFEIPLTGASVSTKKNAA